MPCFYAFAAGVVTATATTPASTTTTARADIVVEKACGPSQDVGAFVDVVMEDCYGALEDVVMQEAMQTPNVPRTDDIFVALARDAHILARRPLLEMLRARVSVVLLV